MTAGPDPIRIFKATWRDLGELKNLEKSCFGEEAWPLLDLISVLSLPGLIRLKAENLQGEMVGFVSGERYPAEGTGWITTIGVLPEYRRLHIGDHLLETCEQELNLPSIRLCVREDNQAALELYKKAGYHRMSIWKNYYQRGQDAIVLEKNLKPKPH